MLVLIPAACYPVYPAVAARGPLPGRGRHRRPGRLVRLSATSRRRTQPACRCSTSARWSVLAMPDIGSASGVTRGRSRRSRSSRALGLDAKADVASDPFFGRSGRDARAKPAVSGAEARGERSRSLRRSRPRSPRSTTTASISRRCTISGSRTASQRTHGVPRLRARAHHAGAAQHARPRSRRRGRATLPRSCGPARSSHRLVRLFDVDPAGSRPASDPRGGAGVPGDELLRGHPDRAHAAARRRTNRGARHDVFARTSKATSGRSSSRIRTTSRRCSGSRSTRCSRTVLFPSRSSSRSGRPDAHRRARLLLLPDTEATAYRAEHVKSSAVIVWDRPEAGSNSGTSTTAGCTSSRARTTGASYVSVTCRRGPPAIHGARAVRRRAAPRRRGTTPGGAGDASRGILTGGRQRTRSGASAPRCSRAAQPACRQARGLSRIRICDGANGWIGVRTMCVACRLAVRRSGCSRLRGPARDRRRVESALVQARQEARVRLRADRRAAGSRVGRGDARPRRARCGA